MTQAELLAAVRAVLRDATGTGTELLWSDAELINTYGNQARDRMFIECRYLLLDSTTATDIETSPLPLCRLSLVADTNKYSMSAKILEYFDIQLASQTAPLEAIRRDELPAVYDNWRTLASDVPKYYCTDLETDAVFIFPPPSANDTAYLTVSRHPLARLSTTASPAPTLGFREEYHADLIPGILALALMKKDVETERPQQALEHEQRFLQRCYEIRQELYRRYNGSRLSRSDTRMC